MAQLHPDYSHRLAFIKHVLSVALDHGKLPEPFCSKAILDLHDAVELFVQLVAESVGATVPKKADFLEYWPALKSALGVDVPHQPAMKRLNQARVGLKHSGIRPSRTEIDELSAKTSAFFDDASRLVFGTPFDQLSAVSLVMYEPAASRLRRSEELLASNDLAPAAQLCAVAFEEVMALFRSKSADNWRRSPFPRLSEMTHFSSVHLGWEWSKNNKELGKHLAKIGGAFGDIEPVLLMLALGIEYRSYARFMKLMPYADAMMDGSYTIGMPQSPLTERDIMFSTDFVTQAALCLQELDPEPPAAGARHEFGSEPFFAVMLPARGTVPERQVVGELVNIGGGWEAWIRHEEDLARICRRKDREQTVGYLRKYKQQRIQDDGGRDLKAPETPSQAQ